MAPSIPSTASSSGSDPQAAAQLQTLVSKLQNNDQPLSPQEIQKIIAESTTKVTSKSMHQAVKKVDTARAKLKAAKDARQKLHMAWTGYVEESIRRWKSFADDFTKKDAALETELNAARYSLMDAKRHLDAMKELHSKQDVDLDAVEVVSEGEMEEESTTKVDTAEMIQQSISSVVESLDKIRVRPAEENADDTNANKKARRDSNDSSVPGARAMSPFGGPGR